jgi:hypothetical protein
MRTVEPESRASHWRPALVLGVATGVSSALHTAYFLGRPPGVLIAVGLESAVVGFFMAWAGLWLGAPLGLDAPLVRAWTSRRAFAGEARWLWAALTGVAAGGLVVGFYVAYFGYFGSELVFTRSGLAAYSKGALASFDGGIAEEVKVHLFLMTAIAWCLAKATRSKAAWVFVTAAVVAALAFDATRFPLHFFSTVRTDLLVRLVFLDLLAGPAFGAIFWRWGIEHAMVAHFCCELVQRMSRGG